MNKDDLRSLVRREVESATNYTDAELTDHRLKALEYYHGEPFGNEQEGRSRVVLTTVADTVDFMLPQLMRIFTATDHYGEFKPRSPDDVAAAQQATDYAAYVVQCNDGFPLLHNWFKDALLFKIGVVKAYWDETTDTTEESYEDLSDTEFEALQSDPDVEIAEHGESVALGIGADGQPTQDRRHSATVRRKETSGQIRLENVPPDEFLLEKNARGPIDRLRFCAHRTTKTVSDLVALGYDADTIEEHKSTGDGEHSEERQTRFKDVDADTLEDRPDEVLVTECYVRADFDGDDIAELRRVLCIGEGLEILENEPCEKIPFAALSPILMPHRLIGRSVAELVMDIQMISSTLLRQSLDNLYSNNNATMAAVEGQVNFDDLLNPLPGGIVRIRQQGAVQAITPPVMVGEAMNMLQYLADVNENRTGISKAAAGLDADALQSTTAAAVNATITAAQGKLEMIARTFGETGVKALFERILHLAQKHVTEAQYIRLRGQFVPVDPRAWSNKYDFVVNVGLGTGNTSEKLQALMAIAAKQEAIIQLTGPNNPIVKPHQYAATLAKLVEAAGFKDTETYFNRPERVFAEMQQMAQQPPAPDPKLQADMMRAQAEMQLAQQKAQAEMQLAREKAAADIQLDRDKLNAEMALRQAELEGERQLRAAEIVVKGSASTNLPRAQ